MDVTSLRPTELAKSLPKQGNALLPVWIVLTSRYQHADPPQSLGLLRARCERPSSRRAADKCDEFASPHRLTPQALTLPCCGLHCASRQILTANVRFGSMLFKKSAAIEDFGL